MVTELRKMLGEQVDLDLDIGGIGTRVDRQHRQCPGTDTTRRSLMATDFLSTLAPTLKTEMRPINGHVTVPERGQAVAGVLLGIILIAS
jgi:hypothetical protein